MKSTNLKILQENGINVPKFIVVNDINSIDLKFSKSQKFAVRSSFDVEDCKNNSFAGQFDTFLNVDRKDVKETFIKVQKSYLKGNVKDYSNYKNVNLSNDIEKSYVIVQEMVEAEYSGIMFTANPLGILNEMVIVLGKGLGNNVVEDRIDTTTYYYNQDDELYYYELNQDSPTINEKILKNLIQIGYKIKNIFNNHMDIEFAIKDSTIYILQARPITTLNVQEVIVLDNSNIVESYPGITLPLTQSFVKEIYYKVFKSCLLRVSKNTKLVDSMNETLKNMTDIANGRIYYRISNWYSVLKLLPFSKKIIPIWQNMLGINNKLVVSNDNKVNPLIKIFITISFIYYFCDTPNSMKRLNSYFKEKLPYYKSRIDSANSIDELLNLYEDIKESLSSKWDITLINDMYSFIFTSLAGDKNKETIANIKNLESMKPILEVYRLVDVAKEFGFQSDKYINLKNDYIDLYGDRCINELKLETPTYRTNPKLLDDYVKTKLDNQNNIRLNQKYNNNVSNNIFVKKAKLGISNREVSRMNRTRIFGLARDIMLKIGKILMHQNRLSNQQDIFYLFYDELYNDNIDYKELVEKRKVEYQNYDKLPAFGRLVFSNGIINKSIHNINVDTLNHHDTLCGIASSVGLIKGEVLVIENPTQDICTKDKIIVTKMTDPGWVFLIENALGIIAEKGSLLSHTAIITRELKKPSVVNVKDATKILKSGDIIELDAYNGKITILNH